MQNIATFGFMKINMFLVTRCWQLQVLFSLEFSVSFDDSLHFFLQYPIPMKKETQGKTDLYIASWLKSQPRDKVRAYSLNASFF